MTRRKILRNKLADVALWLLFVIVTSMVWVGHALNSNRAITLEVKARYVGIASDIAVDEPLPTHFFVRVRDTGHRLRDLVQSEPQITLDLTSQIKRDHGQITITQDLVRHQVTDLLPGTTRLQDVSPEEFTTHYYREKYRDVPVVADIDIQPATQYAAVSEPELSQTHMMVYGKRSQLDTLTCIRTQHLSILDAKDSVDAVVTLLCPSGLRLKQKEVRIRQRLEQYTERNFDIPVRGQGVPAGQQMVFFPSHVRVTAQILMSAYSEVNENHIVVYCNYPHQPGKSLELQAYSTVAGVVSLRTMPHEVEYIIQDAK